MNSVGLIKAARCVLGVRNNFLLKRAGKPTSIFAGNPLNGGVMAGDTLVDNGNSQYYQGPPPVEHEEGLQPMFIMPPGVSSIGSAIAGVGNYLQDPDNAARLKGVSRAAGRAVHKVLTGRGKSNPSNKDIPMYRAARGY